MHQLKSDRTISLTIDVVNCPQSYSNTNQSYSHCVDDVTNIEVERRIARSLSSFPLA